MIKVINKDTAKISSVPALPKADSVKKIRVSDLLLEVNAPREDTVITTSSEASGIDLFIIEMTAKASYTKLSSPNRELEWLDRLGETKALFQELSIVVRDPVAWARKHSTNVQAFMVEHSLRYGLELPNKQKRGKREHVVGESAILHPTA